MAKEMEEQFNNELQARVSESKEIIKSKITSFLAEYWKGFRRGNLEDFKKSPIILIF